jgi:aminopeptidase
MADPRIQQLAELLVKYSTKIKPGDKAVINAPTSALPLARAIYQEVLKAGGHPLVLPRGDFEDLLYRHATDEQLRFIHEPQRHVTEHYDARFAILAEDNTKKLSGVDPEKMVISDRARTELMKTMMKRSAQVTRSVIGKNRVRNCKRSLTGSKAAKRFISRHREPT